MASRISLLDLEADKRFSEWYVVYLARPPHFFWQKWVKQGFRHCELWRPYQFGKNVEDVAWLRLTPTFELLESEIVFDWRPPWMLFPDCTVQKVQVISRHYQVRQWFHFGPVTCTETVKNALAVNSFWIRTPYQLYKFLKKQNGVIRA